MKADGKVLKSELDYVKDVLKKSFGLEKARQLTLMLREVINKDIINYNKTFKEKNLPALITELKETLISN